MSRTWAQRRLRVEREADRAVVASLSRMSEDVGRVLLRFAQSNGGEMVIPNTRTIRDRIDQAIWDEVVRPYFIGTGTDPLRGPEPQSPYTRLLVDWFRRAIEVQAEQHRAIIERYARRDMVVLRWLTMARPRVREMRGNGRRERPDVGLIHLHEMGWDGAHECGEGCDHHHGVVAEIEDRRLWYDPYHMFVYKNSPYRLSDRVWRTSIETRANIDRVLAYHIPRGTGAVKFADELVRYLQPGERGITTRTPYGVEGNYSARRLARTEVTAAGTRSFMNAAIANPYVQGVTISRTSFGEPCPICDPQVGTFLLEELQNTPPFHPHCMCNLTSEVVPNPAAVTADLRLEIDARTERALALQGAFNSDWLVDALLYGWFVYEVVQQLQGE
jgi:hypothetical protein